MKQNRENDAYLAAQKEMSGVIVIGSEAMAAALADSQIYIQSLYQAHLASDNRGLTFGSFLLTAGSALYIYPLLPNENIVEHHLLTLSLILGVWLFLCGVGCFVSVWPRRFCLPGTSPEGWLPSNWFKLDDFSNENVLVERLTSIHFQVARNRAIAARKANIQRTAIAFALVGTVACGILSRFPNCFEL